MTRFLQNHYAMTREGARDLNKSIWWTVLQFLSFMLPIMVCTFFTRDVLRVFSGKAQDLSWSIWAYVGVSLAILALIYVINYFQYGSTYTRIYDESAKTRIKLAETLRQLPLSFFGQKDIADLSSTIMEDTNQIENLFSHNVPHVYASIISILLMAVMMFSFDWRLALALFWVVPVAALVFLSSSRYQKKVHSDVYHIKRDVADFIQEGLDNAQVIQSCNEEKNYTGKLNAKLDSYENYLIRTELLIGAVLNLANALLYLGLPTVLICGGTLLARGQVDLFTFLVFLLVSSRIYSPIFEALSNFAALKYLGVRIERMRELNNMPRQTGKEAMHPKGYDIVFEDVDFSYHEDDMLTLRRVSLIARQGEVTALVGPSGGGKSTIAKLAARFWDISRGRITLGGEDISKVDPETLLQNFAIVFQDVTLFDMSVLDNIRIGKKDATDEEVLHAARLAQCDAFVERLPQGYQTPIGENGERLSGGERQRISIARALLKDAPVILLDEATASVDTQNESKIQQAIGQLIQNKTVLVIAHRMRTVLGADKIIVVADGKIIESGTPKELLEQKGRFAAMVEAQSSSA
ncbi:MAG: ABC transporter ATP-binding protein [Clostridiales bacterium]|nr:ABC transporter ATP-binding protein [Bacillota bacterium]NLL55541.1 ABC transporter ATP-binding protein [Clostridiales bacterium]